MNSDWLQNRHKQSGMKKLSNLLILILVGLYLGGGAFAKKNKRKGGMFWISLFLIIMILLSLIAFIDQKSK